MDCRIESGNDDASPQRPFAMPLHKRRAVLIKPTLENRHRGGNVSNESDATRFSVTYSDDELRSYSRLMARRYARGHNDYTFFGLMILAIFVVGLAVLGAVDLGLVEAAAVRSVLVTAYVAFVAGWLGYWYLVQRYFSKHLGRQSLRGPWDYWFGAAGLGYKGATIEVRFSWRAVQSVDDLGAIVLFRCSNHAVFVPARMFADDAARKDFVAVSAARIKAAAEGTP
jgi:hypothetical protein